MQGALRDSAARYGSISRLLHWGMAVLFAWQLASVLARVLFSDSAFDEFMWATHRPTGTLLLLLLLIRLGWSISNAGRRPPSVNVAARLGHRLLYVLMLLVPSLGLLRHYGSGRSFEPFGVPLMSGFEDDRIEWMVAAGNMLHGLLGWTLLALIAGHIGMAYWHRRYGEQDVMPRMAGTPR